MENLFRWSLRKQVFFGVVILIEVLILTGFMSKKVFAETSDKFTFRIYSGDQFVERSIDLKVYSPDQYIYVKSKGIVAIIPKNKLNNLIPWRDYNVEPAMEWLSKNGGTILAYSWVPPEVPAAIYIYVNQKTGWRSTDDIPLGGNPYNSSGWEVGKIYINKSIDTSMWQNGMTYDCNTDELKKNGVVVPKDYSYEYSSSIPNVDNMNLRQHYIYKLGPVYIGLNKLKYDISWTAPTDTTLKLEVQVMGKYNSYTRSFMKQSYNSPYYPDTGVYLLPSDANYTFNITSLSEELTKKAFADVNVQKQNQPDYVIPSALYYRYVRLDDIKQKVLYGNWTRLSISYLGASGVTDASFDKIKQTTTKDSSTGETVYTDTPIDGNQTTYVNPIDGNKISESETFNAASDTLNNAFDKSIDSIKSVTSWVGEVPGLIGKIFNFFPPELMVIVSLGMTMAIILRIAGR